MIGSLSPGWRRVPYLDALPELIERDFEVVQFDAHPKTTSRCTHRVTLDSRPAVEHHAPAKTQDVLSQAPELLFDLYANVPVPRARAEGPLPLILRETHGATFDSKLFRECRLCRRGQPTGEKQPGLLHRCHSNSCGGPGSDAR